MIIRQIKIRGFGGLKNVSFSLDNKINVIYGVNEKGKSTIEAFIKAMLYGFSKKKINGDNERKRYMPFCSETMGGELIVEHNNKEYIIKRNFGKTKKQDLSEVLDAISGTEALEVSVDEPGRTFLGINRSTFEKTLFISQLGVVISNDGEEEIMERLTAIFGCGDQEVPVSRAIDKLQLIKKDLTTVRGVGKLDINKKKEQELIREEYESNLLCEKNLESEHKLYIQKENRIRLEQEINKLEVYKKYLKKAILQKEYLEIAEFLKRTEELKEKEAKIINDLKVGSEIINQSYLDNLRNNNIQYNSMLGNLNEIYLERNLIITQIERLNDQLEEFDFINKFGNGLKEKIINLKYEQQSLQEKINSIHKNINEIKTYENDIKNKIDSFKSYEILHKLKGQIEDTFSEYETKLYQMKSLAENKNVIWRNIFLIASFISTILGIVLLFNSLPFKILGVIIILFSISFIIGSIFIKGNNSTKRLSNQVIEIENRLEEYLSITNTKDYVELMSIVKKYTALRSYQDKVQFMINEKRKLSSEQELSSLNQKFTDNNNMINKIKNASKCNSIDELLDKISRYDELKMKLYSVELDYANKEKNIKMCKQALNDKENEIREKLKLLNSEDLDLSTLPEYIDNYSLKLKRYNEVQNNLDSIELTYKALLKDRDIEKIKEELKDLISNDNPYSFETEEEVELEEKKRTKELLECEKNIKDLENNIRNRFIGKRDLVTIKQELDETKEKINNQDKKVKAIQLATDVLNQCLDETRTEIGPELNRMVAENFNTLTSNKYSEVLLGDNYQMMVRDSSNLFNGSYLSNGALDQLYLSLRIAFIELLFKNEEQLVILDDAFIQYDDNRRKEALMLLIKRITGQLIIFSCQNVEINILYEENIKFNYIEL